MIREFSGFEQGVGHEKKREITKSCNEMLPPVLMSYSSENYLLSLITDEYRSAGEGERFALPLYIFAFCGASIFKYVDTQVTRDRKMAGGPHRTL